MNKITDIELEQVIRDKHSSLGYDLGWSLIYGPYETMWNPDYPIAFFGLNPGGKDPSETIFYEGEGSAYRTEDWGRGRGKGGRPLQLQIQALYRSISEKMGPSISFKELMDKSLMANFVPFRSPNWKSLTNSSGV
jgi:hypothetical protein